MYPKELWALAKIKAYSKQSEPFIHIDGDVFIYSKFEERLHNSQLVAQNPEKATIYYQSKFSDVKNHLTYLPGFIDIEFTNNPICSFNAGIIGGNDVEFFKKYSCEVFDFVNKNIFGPAHLPSHSLVNFNILFEQIFFYNLSRKEGKEVTCLFDKVFEDNGYKYDDLGDFTTIPFLNTFLHFIGPIKRNKRACDLMSSVLLRDHPEYFFKVAFLFEAPFSKYYLQNQKNINLEDWELKYTKNQLSKIETSNEEVIGKIPGLTIQKSVANYLKLNSNNFGNTSSQSEIHTEKDVILSEASKYEATLGEILKEFNNISCKYLIARDVSSTRHFNFFYQPREIQLKRNLQQDSLVKIIETVYDWTKFYKDEIPDTSDLKIKQDALVFIAIVPEIFYSHYKQILLEDLDYYIFTVLEDAATLEHLLEQLKLCFNPDDIKNNYDNFFELVILKLKNLNNNKCIRIIDDSDNEYSI